MGLKNDTVSEKKMKRNKKKDDDEDENKDGEMKTKEEKEQNNRGGVYLGLWRQKRAHLMKGGRRLTRNCVGCGGSRAPETTIDDVGTSRLTLRAMLSISCFFRQEQRTPREMSLQMFFSLGAAFWELLRKKKKNRLKPDEQLKKMD